MPDANRPDEVTGSSKELEDQILVSQQIMEEILEMLGQAWDENARLKEQLDQCRVDYAEATAPKGKDLAAGDGASTTETDGVLIVDDSGLMRDRLKTVLNQLNINVVGVAADGRDGLVKALEKAPRLVILDYVMPVMDGLEFLRELRQKRQDIRVIVCTGNISREVSQEMVLLGINEILTKPIQLDRFIQAVVRALEP